LFGSGDGCIIRSASNVVVSIQRYPHGGNSFLIGSSAAAATDWSADCAAFDAAALADM